MRLEFSLLQIDDSPFSLSMATIECYLYIRTQEHKSQVLTAIRLHICRLSATAIFAKEMFSFQPAEITANCCGVFGQME